MEESIEEIQKEISIKEKKVQKYKKSLEESISFLPNAQDKAKTTSELMRSKKPGDRLIHLDNMLTVAETNMDIANLKLIISLEERQIELLKSKLERMLQESSQKEQ